MRRIAANEADNYLVKDFAEVFVRIDHDITPMLPNEVKEEMMAGMLIQAGLESGLATAAETQECNELLGLAHAV